MEFFLKLRYSLPILFLIFLPGNLHAQTYFQFTSNTGNSANIAIPFSINPTVGFEPLQPGDEIGVFTPDSLCVGATVWNGETSVGITVWQNDMMTEIKDGIEPGEEMFFRVWSSQDSIEYKAVDVTYAVGNGIYEKNGMYVLESLTAIPYPAAPALINPVDGANDLDVEVEFLWEPASWTDLYIFQAAHTPLFTGIVEEHTLEDTQIILTLDYNTTYYWRVRSSNLTGSSGWSEIRHFTTESLPDSLSIPLDGGWNIISSYVDPEIPDMSFIFGDINDPALFVKNGAGDVYWPASEIFELTHWNSSEGYYVHVSSPVSLLVSGDRINPVTTPVSLDDGWSIIPYYHAEPLDITTALEGIAQQLVVVKDGDGDIYWPEHGINTIGQMQPGRGYHLYMSAPATLYYPDIPQGGGITYSNPAPGRPDFYVPEYTHTGSNAILLLLYPDGKDNDEIGVFTESGLLIGGGVVHDSRAVITMWGNNPLTEDITEGAVDGEELFLSVWSHQLKYERPLDLESIENVLLQNANEESLIYRTDGLYVATAEDENTEFPGFIPDRYELTQNYPNPFNPTTQIRYGIPDDSRVLLEVYTVTGQRVAVLVDEHKSAGVYTVNFNAAGLSSGTYLYRLRAGYYVETKRMVLVR